jgi:nucleotide-binding universal stress UspA family protein
MITRSARCRSILVPLDGSKPAEQAIPVAQAIAQRARCKLKLVLVHQPPVVTKAGPDHIKLQLAKLKADREYLKSVTAAVRERLGRPVSSAVLQGHPVAQTLATYCQKLGADLVVMTSHSRGGLRRAWLGSVTDQLIRSTEVPVLVVRPGAVEGGGPAWEAGEILVALDGSPLAEAALGPAMEVARLWDAELSLVQVVPPMLPASPQLTVPPGFWHQANASRRGSAEDYVRDVAERVRESGIRASGVAVMGTNVPETLIDLAEPKRVSLMVVATHGLGGVGRVVLGSVADEVVRGAKVPTLVVRPTHRPAGARRVLRRGTSVGGRGAAGEAIRGR